MCYTSTFDWLKLLMRVAAMLALILTNAFMQVRFNFCQMVSRGYKLIVSDGESYLCPYNSAST